LCCFKQAAASPPAGAAYPVAHDHKERTMTPAVTPELTPAQQALLDVFMTP